jgi:hypothetical protein
LACLLQGLLQPSQANVRSLGVNVDHPACDRCHVIGAGCRGLGRKIARGFAMFGRVPTSPMSRNNVRKLTQTRLAQTVGDVSG